MSKRWPQPIPRQAFRSKRPAEPPLEDSWLFKINPQRALELASKKRGGK